MPSPSRSASVSSTGCRSPPTCASTPTCASSRRASPTIPDLRIATSLVDYIFRRLAVDYLLLEERVELGVLSTSERMQPTLPGVEEVATTSSGVVESVDPVISTVVDASAPSMVDPALRPGQDLESSGFEIRTTGRSVLLPVRQHHAARGLLFRLRELRHDKRLLVAGPPGGPRPPARRPLPAPRDHMNSPELPEAEHERVGALVRRLRLRDDLDPGRGRRV